MGRCLIVANQTLGGDALDRAVRDRIAGGVTHFFVLVPVTPPTEESSVWTFGFAVDNVAAGSSSRSAFERDQRRREARFEARFEARRRATRRLERMIEAIRAAGGDATGRVGDADPVVAVKEALGHLDVDEVIISTLPPGLSRWAKRDLPNRVARMTPVPVVTVEAEH